MLWRSSMLAATWAERHFLSTPLCTLLGILLVNMLERAHQCEHTGKCTLWLSSAEFTEMLQFFPELAGPIPICVS